jgi:hypothetical protein
MLESNAYSNLNTTVDRTEAVNHAMTLMIDSIYLAIYIKRDIFSNSSVAHISDCIYKNFSEVTLIHSKFKFNDIEYSTFENFRVLIDTILDNRLPVRGMVDVDFIKALFMRIPSSTILVEYANLVLAIANQYNKELPRMCVPKFHIFPLNGRYLRTIHLVPAIFKLESNSFYNRGFQNLLNGIKPINAQSLNKDIYDLCSIIAIDVLPDISNGIGLLYLPFEHAVKYNKFVLPDSGSIKDHLIRYIDIRNIVMTNSAAFESTDYTDAVEAMETTTSPNDQKEIEESSQPTTPEETQEDKDASDTTDTNPDNQIDPNAPANPEMETTEEKPKPPLLGFVFELATNETLDELLYKISIAKYIDNVTQFNHDELPFETVTLLSKWKSMFLFLVTAEETKKLFSELKIKDI